MIEYIVDIDLNEVRRRVVSITQRTTRINTAEATPASVNAMAEDAPAADMINEWAGRYAQEAQGRMAAYVTKGCETAKLPGVLHIHLGMPDTWLQCGEELKRNTYSFIVNSCLAEWYEMVDPNKATRYASKAAEDSDSIHYCVCKRLPGTNRKQYRPF